MSPQPFVRPAQVGDGPALRRLQRQLTEPSPQLLEAALAEREVTDLSDRESAGVGDRESTGVGEQESAGVRDKDTSTSQPLRAWRLLVSTESTDTPVGYLLASVGTTTHIAELVVDSAARRTGRATALLSVVCETASPPLTVCVAADNTAARSLYDQTGFETVSRSTEQFENSEAVILQYDPDETA